MSTGPWFVRRTGGVGWRPVTWQGWMVTGVAVALAVTTLLVSRIHKSPAGLGVLMVIAALYILVAAVTARQPATAGVRADGDSVAAPEPRVSQRPPLTAPQPRPALREEASVLAVDGLTKTFGDRVAFADISFSVSAGEVFGFLGPNGAGKTTTVRTLGTLIRPSAGSAVVAGLPLTPDNGEAIRQRISIMPEAPGLYLRLSVRENLAFFADLFRVQDPRTRIAAALAAVNLTTRADDLCGTLSKGLRQRAALARALLNDPAILFLDEPTSGLDPVATREVHGLIDGLRQRGVTVFLTTHRLDEAERLCDRVAILNTTLRMLGRPDELRAQLFSRTLVVVTAAPLPEPDRVLGQVAGVESWHRDESGRYILTVTDPRQVSPAVVRALVSADAEVVSVSEQRHSLEDVYLELIAEDVEAQAR